METPFLLYCFGTGGGHLPEARHQRTLHGRRVPKDGAVLHRVRASVGVDILHR